MPNIQSTFNEIIYACIQRDQKAYKENCFSKMDLFQTTFKNYYWKIGT
jgi:hypothetical protein